MNSAHKTSGFTLLEILVVMAIIAVLLYFLIQSIAIFRRNVILQQASDQVSTVLTETSNYAGNNILPDGFSVENDKIYGYAIAIENNNLVRKVCTKALISNVWVCDNSTSETLLEDVLISIRLNADCEGVLFINLSGDVKIGSLGNFDSDGICTVELSHAEDTRIFRKIVFDGSKNNYEFKNAE